LTGWRFPNAKANQSCQGLARDRNMSNREGWSADEVIGDSFRWLIYECMLYPRLYARLTMEQSLMLILPETHRLPRTALGLEDVSPPAPECMFLADMLIQ